MKWKKPSKKSAREYTKMNGNLLLDTNIIVSLLRGDEILDRRLAGANGLLIPTIAMGELFVGAYKSSKTIENLSKIESFIRDVVKLPCDLGTAREDGRIRDELRKKGRPIPDNDIWIAAMAIQHSLTLVTRDKHFNEIDRLDKTCW